MESRFSIAEFREWLAFRREGAFVAASPGHAPAAIEALGAASLEDAKHCHASLVGATGADIAAVGDFEPEALAKLVEVNDLGPAGVFTVVQTPVMWSGGTILFRAKAASGLTVTDGLFRVARNGTSTLLAAEGDGLRDGTADEPVGHHHEELHAHERREIGVAERGEHPVEEGTEPREDADEAVAAEAEPRGDRRREAE